jgi:hypothetical protein
LFSSECFHPGRDKATNDRQRKKALNLSSNEHATDPSASAYDGRRLRVTLIVLSLPRPKSLAAWCGACAARGRSGDPRACVVDRRHMVTCHAGVSRALDGSAAARGRPTGMGATWGGRSSSRHPRPRTLRAGAENGLATHRSLPMPTPAPHGNAVGTRPCHAPCAARPRLGD